MLDSLKNALHNPDGQYFFWGLGKRYREMKQKLAWMILPLIRRRIRRLLAVAGDGENDHANLLVKTIGDFSGFPVTVTDSSRARILAAADEIVAGYYDLLGSGRVQLRPIDWHSDFKSGFAWPRGKYYLNYIQVDYGNTADVKVPRELSRSHHLLILGQAYLLTGEDKYTREFRAQVENWIEENPLMRSINWGCAMDVAIRAANWIYALGMFVGSPLIDRGFLEKIRVSLFEHGYFIFRNLEKKYRNSNNHFFSNLAGLLFLGMLFSSTREGRRWFEYALPEYYGEIRSQFLPCGASYERSISYNRLMVELAVYPYLLLIRNGINIPLDIRHRLDTMFDFVLHYLKPDGEAPVIGDQDNGRFLPFGLRQQTDHRYLLAIGAALRQDPVMKKYADPEAPEIFFLLRSGGRETLCALVPSASDIGSKAFPDAGFCVLRHNERYMFITNSGAAAYPDQTRQWGSHAHADLLSFELALGGTTFLVDPGTFLYTSSPKERNLFRSTRMHNTVTVDGQDQHRLSETNIFRCLEIAEPVDFEFLGGEEKDIFSGSHNGFMRLDSPVFHRRTFIFDKSASTWEIIDRLSGEGEHVLCWHFHFDSGIDFEIAGNTVRTRRKQGPNLELAFSAPGAACLRKRGDFVSKSYGVKTPSFTLEIELPATCPLETKTRIAVI